MINGVLAQLGERGLCKPEVRGSIPLCSTKINRSGFARTFFCCCVPDGTGIGGENPED